MYELRSIDKSLAKNYIYVTYIYHEHLLLKEYSTIEHVLGLDPQRRSWPVELDTWITGCSFLGLPLPVTWSWPAASAAPKLHGIPKPNSARWWCSVCSVFGFRCSSLELGVGLGLGFRLGLWLKPAARRPVSSAPIAPLRSTSSTRNAWEFRS